MTESSPGTARRQPREIYTVREKEIPVLFSLPRIPHSALLCHASLGNGESAAPYRQKWQTPVVEARISRAEKRIPPSSRGDEKGETSKPIEQLGRIPVYGGPDKRLDLAMLFPTVDSKRPPLVVG